MTATHPARDTDPAPAPHGNGHDRGPKCAVHEAAIVELRTSLSRLETRVTEEFLGVFGALSRVETKIDRLVEGVQIGQVQRAPLPSLDWDLDENTMHGREDPHMAATVWATRARETAMMLEEARAGLERARTEASAAKARLEERDRRSDRAVAVSMARWKVVAGIIATVLTSGGGVLLLTKLLGG